MLNPFPSTMQSQLLQAYLYKVKAGIESYTPITAEAWSDFSDLLELKDLPKGAFYIREGAPTRHFAFICKGLIRCFLSDNEGREYNKTFFYEGRIAAALASLIQHKPSSLSLEALEDCVLLEADFHAVTALFDKHHCIERYYRIFLEQHWVLPKEERELSFVLQQADARYDAFLEKYPGLDQRIPQYHIAAHIGVTPTQLSRIRSQRAQ